MFIKKITTILFLTLLLLSIGIAAPQVDGCKQINSQVPFNTQYWQMCYIQDTPSLAALNDQEYSVEITETNTGNVVWRTNKVRPECLSSYEGGVFDPNCEYFTSIDGSTKTNFIIDHPFNVGTNYTTTISVGVHSNHTTFVVTQPTINTLIFENVTEYGSEIYYKGRLITAKPTVCSAVIYRNELNYSQRVEEPIPLVQTGKDLEFRLSTLGLVSGRIYDMEISCDDYSTYTNSFKIQMVTPQRDFEKVLSFVWNNLIIIIGITLGCIIFFSVIILAKGLIKGEEA